MVNHDSLKIALQDTVPLSLKWTDTVFKPRSRIQQVCPWLAAAEGAARKESLEWVSELTKCPVNRDTAWGGKHASLALSAPSPPATIHKASARQWWWWLIGRTALMKLTLMHRLYGAPVYYSVRPLESGWSIMNGAPPTVPSCLASRLPGWQASRLPDRLAG